MKRRAFRLRAAGVAAAAAVAAGVLATAALAVVGGSPDNGQHPYVGMAVYFPTGNPADGFELCSGSLVSATVFVTAAHCFPDGAQVFVDMNDNALADMHQAGFGSAQLGLNHVDQNWTGGNGLAHFDRNDIAVITLPSPGFPQPNDRYAQLPPQQGYDDTLAKSHQVEIVGYGLRDTKDPRSVGTRMVAPARIIPGGGATGSEFLKLSSNPAQGGATCQGDSGGPDLIGDVMVSISSYGPSATCNAVAYSQRLDTPEALAFIGHFLALS